VSAITPAQTGELIALAEGLAGPPVTIVHLPDPGQAEIQWVTSTVGRPPVATVSPVSDKHE
jgi:hypothetical protein